MLPFVKRKLALSSVVLMLLTLASTTNGHYHNPIVSSILAILFIIFTVYTIKLLLKYTALHHTHN